MKTREEIDEEFEQDCLRSDEYEDRKEAKEKWRRAIQELEKKGWVWE